VLGGSSGAPFTPRPCFWRRLLSKTLSVMSDADRERFTNVQMPRWYRITAWIVRVAGFIVCLSSGWQMTHQEASASSWPLAGVFVGAALLGLPSLPKAFIEQRNRIRGLKDGSFNEFLKHERQKDR